jgi:hypothetical protein
MNYGKNFFSLFCLLILLSCGNQTPKRFPNKRSEMAVAMRNMTDAMLKTKSSLTQSEITLLKFKSFKNKKFTDTSFESDWFANMSDVLLNNAKYFDNNPSIETFHTVVQTCQSCHENTCPGPLQQIQDLYIE